MTSNGLESRGDIEGARRLLKVAKKWSESAAAMLKMVQDYEVGGSAITSRNDLVEFARTQALGSENDLQQAEAYSKEVDQRWEVIDVEDDDEDAPPTKEISGADAVQNSNEGSTSDGDVVVLSNSDNDESSSGPVATNISGAGTSTSGVGLTSDPNNHNDGVNVAAREARVNTSLENDDVPYHMTVEGCGVSDLNGTYTLVGFHNDAPKYSKPKEADSETHYTILLDKTKTWNKARGVVEKWILFESTNSDCGAGICYYTAHPDGMEKLPPKKWRVTNGDIWIGEKRIKSGRYRGRGRHPAPKLISGECDNEIQNLPHNVGTVEELEIEGCGNSEINGIYKKRGHYNGLPSYFKMSSMNGLPHVNIRAGPYRDYHISGYRYWYISVCRRDCWLNYFVLDDTTDRLPLGKCWTQIHWNASDNSPLVKVGATRNAQIDHQSKRARYN